MPVNPWFVSRWRTTRYPSVHSFIACMGLGAMLFAPISRANSELTVNVRLNIVQPTCNLAVHDILVPFDAHDLKTTGLAVDSLEPIELKIKFKDCSHVTKMNFTFEEPPPIGNGLKFYVGLGEEPERHAFNSVIPVTKSNTNTSFEPIFYIKPFRESCSADGSRKFTCSAVRVGPYSVAIPFRVTYE